MPEVIAETLVAIRPQTKAGDFEREIRQAVNDAERRAPAVDVPIRAEGATKQIAGLGRAVKGVLALEGLSRGVQIVGDLADASGDLAEAQNAANVQFGSGVSIISDFAAESATALGISERAALEAGSAFGGMFGNIGLAAEESAVLSRGAVQLAGDLASLRNLRVDDALIKIQSGLAGETEPLRRFGVDITEAAVSAKAFELGIAGAGEELNQGQKVLARYALIAEQLDEAHGDFARTNEEYANATRTLTAAQEDLSAHIGGNLTPILAEAATNLAFLAKEGKESNSSMSASTALWVNPLTAGVAALNKGLSALRERYGDAESSTDVYAEAQAALEESIRTATDSLVDQAKTLDRQVAAILDGVEAGLSQRDAARDVADAQRDVAEAEEEYAQALAGTGPFAEKAADAADKLADANRGLVRSQQRVRELTLDIGEAQEELAAAQIRHGVGSKEARDAARQLERAQFDLGEANKDVADATDDVTDAQKEATEAANRSKAIEDAARRLEDARFALERSTLRAASADVEFARTQAESRGETWDTKDAIDAAVTALDKWTTNLGNDSPFAQNLRARTWELAALRGEAEKVAGLFAMEPPQVGAGDLAPGAVGAGGLGPAVGASALSGGAAGTSALQSGGPAIGQVIINYPVDLDLLLEQAEYAAGIGD